MNSKQEETLKEIETIMNGLIESGGVRFDILTDRFLNRERNALRLTSTRKLITNEIRDKLIENYGDVLPILFQSGHCRNIDFSRVNGFCIWQSDYGFDPYERRLRDNDNYHIEGVYRYF